MGTIQECDHGEPCSTTRHTLSSDHLQSTIVPTDLDATKDSDRLKKYQFQKSIPLPKVWISETILQENSAG